MSGNEETKEDQASTRSTRSDDGDGRDESALSPSDVAKTRLTQADKGRLAARVKPLVKPALEKMLEQITTAEGEEKNEKKANPAISDDPEKLSKPMRQAMAFVIPQVGQLSQLIDDEGAAILEENLAAKKKILKIEEKKNKRMTIAYLSMQADKMMAQYELSSR
jgi:hypothetical protein